MFRPVTSYENACPVPEMTKFNPSFWEVTIASESWDSFAIEDHPYYESPEDQERRLAREDQAKQFWCVLQPVAEEVLTPRQAEIVRMCFFEGMNQRQIAEKLGVAQQSVSEHLYGKLRGTRNVGGALRKLRKACEKKGMKWIW